MERIIQHLKSKTQMIYYYDQTRKLILSLGSEKGNINDDSYPRVLIHIIIR